MIPEPDKTQLGYVDRMLTEPTQAALISLPTGDGKTLVSLATVKATEVTQVLVIAPLNTLDGWQAHIEHVLPRHPFRQIDSSKDGQQAFLDLRAGVEGAYFVTKDYFALSGTSSAPKKKPDGTFTRGRVQKLNWRITVPAVILDECFVAGTEVMTPTGPRNIETLLSGDEVMGFDHTRNCTTVETVVSSMQRTTTSLLGHATPNHPFFVVDSGYVPWGDIEGDDYGYYIGTDLRVLRRAFSTIQEQPEATVLQQVVFDEGPTTHRVTTVDSAPEWASIGREALKNGEGAMGGPRVSAPEYRTYAYPKPVTQPRNGCEDTGDKEGRWGFLRTPNRWKWEVKSSRSPFSWGVGRWLGTVLRGNNPQEHRRGVSAPLQDRLGISGTSTWGRMRRELSQEPQGESKGSEENRPVELPGLDHLAVLEPRDILRYRQVCRSSVRNYATTVYNLETTSGNYFANGFLVHNCHRANNRDTAAYKVLRQLKAGWKLALSATPAGNKFDRMWETARWLWPDLIDRSKQRWIAQWCETAYNPHNYSHIEVVGERNPGAFVRSLPCYITSDGAFKLPTRVISVRTPMTAEQREQYERMKKDSLIWIDENPLVADLPMVQKIRLRQIALGEVTFDEDMNVGFAENCASTKIQACQMILERHKGEQVVFYTDSKRFAYVLGKRIGGSVWTGDLTGKARTDLKAGFIAGRVRYLVAVIAAFGTGTDGIHRAANVEVWCNKSFNDVDNQQCEGRLNRRGQEAHEIVRYELTAPDSGDTLDFERLLTNRRRLQQSL